MYYQEHISLWRADANFRTGCGGRPLSVALWNNRIEQALRLLEARPFTVSVLNRALRLKQLIRP
jgi:hypothetical protein